ncbi:MAG TPA: fatty acid--CoA ligase family protein [Stellaceae bacterium]|nr:fatty acid--CoA ligase family protein [Stellaceae bacterium]
MLASAAMSVAPNALLRFSSLGGRLEELRQCSVLLRTKDQLVAALALIELDGVARRLVLCPPGLSPTHLPAIMAAAEIEAVVSDGAELEPIGGATVVRCGTNLVPLAAERRGTFETEWILLTSGTTGRPKLVVHTLASLAGAITRGSAPAAGSVWSTFYDIRRYGGLQIFLRALLGGTSLVLSNPDETVGEFLVRAAQSGVTHISGTPSHWRRALMSPSAQRIAPRYVRLSGEIADQGILDGLRATYPGAGVAHAFASTEGGVAFDVVDGFAGFPADFIGRSGAAVEMKVEQGSLRLRSNRTAVGYLGGPPLRDRDGFVDTGDLVEQRGERYYFVGRTDGVINVGGLKVHPEEVEAVINRHPSVRMSRVKARKNPITGAVLVADIVVRRAAAETDPAAGAEAIKSEILEACSRQLPPFKVPALLHVVTSLDVTDAGKLVRRDA